MKQAKTSSKIVTEDFFRKELKKQLKTELKNYPTKNGLQSAIQASETRTDIKLDIRFNQFEDKIINLLTQFKSDIFSKIDSFLEESENDRIERTDLRNTVGHHETRITALEHSQKTAKSLA